MTDKLTILVGTMSGTAEMVADELADRFDDAGWTTRVLRMEMVKPALLALGGLWVLCCSTYGTGDVPDNAKALYDSLEAERPDLSSMRYGVVALGDSIYPNTFCFGGRKFDELLASLGATRVANRLEQDSRSGVFPEEAAIAWAEGWLEHAAG